MRRSPQFRTAAAGGGGLVTVLTISCNSPMYRIFRRLIDKAKEEAEAARARGERPPEDPVLLAALAKSIRDPRGSPQTAA